MTYYKANMCLTSNDIQHFGVPGMKWGVRKARKEQKKNERIDRRFKRDQKIISKTYGKYSKYGTPKDDEKDKFMKKQQKNAKLAKRLLGGIQFIDGFQSGFRTGGSLENPKELINSMKMAKENSGSGILDVNRAIMRYGESYYNGDSQPKAVLKSIISYIDSPLTTGIICGIVAKTAVDKR